MFTNAAESGVDVKWLTDPATVNYNKDTLTEENFIAGATSRLAELGADTTLAGDIARWAMGQAPSQEAFNKIKSDPKAVQVLQELIDPLEGLDITVQSFDIPRTVSVYPDQAGIRWWTKAWFNNRKDGEASVEISRQNAILFIRNQVEKDAWLEEHFPRQMEVYHNAIEQTRQQLLAQQINI